MLHSVSDHAGIITITLKCHMQLRWGTPDLQYHEISLERVYCPSFAAAYGVQYHCQCFAFSPHALFVSRMFPDLSCLFTWRGVSGKNGTLMECFSVRGTTTKMMMVPPESTPSFWCCVFRGMTQCVQSFENRKSMNRFLGNSDIRLLLGKHLAVLQ